MYDSYYLWLIYIFLSFFNQQCIFYYYLTLSISIKNVWTYKYIYNLLKYNMYLLSTLASVFGLILDNQEVVGLFVLETLYNNS